MLLPFIAVFWTKSIVASRFCKSSFVHDCKIIQSQQRKNPMIQTQFNCSDQCLEPKSRGKDNTESACNSWHF